MSSVLFYLSLTLFFGVCLLLSLMILMQESKTLGLGASFGGDASSSLFGTSTADVLKTITKALSTVFLISCLALSLWSSVLGSSTTARPKQVETTEQQ